jgi:hypothetical protein
MRDAQCFEAISRLVAGIKCKAGWSVVTLMASSEVCKELHV